MEGEGIEETPSTQPVDLVVDVGPLCEDPGDMPASPESATDIKEVRLLEMKRWQLIAKKEKEQEDAVGDERDPGNPELCGVCSDPLGGTKPDKCVNTSRIALSLLLGWSSSLFI